MAVDTEKVDEPVAADSRDVKSKKTKKSSKPGVSMCKKTSQTSHKPSASVQYDSDTDNDSQVETTSKRRRALIE